MRDAGRLLPVVLLLAIQICQGQNSCVDETFSTWEVSFERLRKISRIAVSGLIAGYSVEVSVSEETFQPLRLANGDHLIVYSTLASSPSWNHLDMIAQAIRIKDAFNATGEVHRQPLVMLTLCDYDTPITAFDDSGFTVESQRAGLIAMYENELLITFRSFRSGIFFFSMADQGDIIVAQLVRGTVQIIFDFGSLSPSWISGGRALDDGMWHSLRWLHQFDSVQLSIDGVLLNQTTPTGLYRKLDLHSQVHVAGRPMDDFSEGIESSFSGCLARVQLNSIDLLAFAPHSSATCSMPRPPSLTLGKDAQAVFPFSFLPFSFEFRILAQAGSLLELKDAENISMVRIGVDESGTLLLYSNATHYKQKSNPQIKVTDGSWHSLSLRIRGNRLEVDVDGLTILWLEGQEVRRVATRLNILILSSTGCYRSATVDFGAAQAIGNVARGVCNFIDRCLLPGICENGGICEQKTLEDYSCRCPDGYTGTNCHTSELPRSCEEWQFLRNVRGRLTKGRNVTIDLDGGGPLPGLSVLCRTEKDDLGMDVMTTVLEHDLKKAIFVTGDLAPGAIRKPLSYGVGVSQLDFLVEGFEHCQQFMKYSCRGGARLMTHGQDRSPSSWYSTRSDKHGLQWGEAPPYSRLCSCAINGSCLHNRMCNCDSGEDAIDEGINAYSQLLPVTGLFLGGTSKQSAIEVEIGPLICRGRISYESVTFNDRNSRLHGSRSISAKTFDLWIQVKFSHQHMTIFVWESSDNLHWFHLYLQEGRVVAEIVNGGEVVQLQSASPINNNKWHTIYWEADGRGMKLKVDSRTVALNRTLILPSALHWTVGSRTSTGNSGYAGVIRNVYLCGEELHLSTMARRESEQGVVAGEDGFCRAGLCKNGGFCVDKYDGYSCDCSMTPFGGEDCSKEYGMWVPLGSSLSIPWQNPAHISMCHRIAVQTKMSNISLVRSKALFADTSFNLTVNQFGQTSVSAYDGELFTHQDTFKKINISDDVLHDISFCAGEKDFNLTIDGERVIYIEGNWSFFQSFNVWTLLDANFTGCVSRLQVGASFPLKDAKGARLAYSDRIRFGMCPVQVEQKMTSSVPTDGSSGIRIDAVNQQYQYIKIVSITTLSVLFLFVGLAILTIVMICYMRSRPDGVYKTNEDGAQNCSPSSYRSEEPLVKNQQNKEYFC